MFNVRVVGGLVGEMLGAEGGEREQSWSGEESHVELTHVLIFLINTTSILKHGHRSISNS